MGFRALLPLFIILFIFVLLFGTSRLRNVGEDLGAAIKGFRKGLDGENLKNSHDIDDINK